MSSPSVEQGKKETGDGTRINPVGDTRPRYHAFISYSRAADDRLAPALQSALQRFAKPWYRRQILRIFRDQTTLEMTPDVWPEIRRALDASEFLILLASQEAARSQWIALEVEHWLTHKSLDRVLIVLTGGSLVWDPRSNRFDPQRTDALPTTLLASEGLPNYKDLTALRQSEQLDLKNPAFLDAVASLAARVHGRPKDELAGEEVKQHRQFVTIARVFVILLILLACATTGLAFYARRQANLAHRELVNTQIAVGQQVADEGRVLEALPRFARALQLDEGDPIRERIHRVRVNTHLEQGMTLPSIFLHKGVVESAEFVGADGVAVASTLEDSIHLWDLNTRDVQNLRVADHASRIVLSADGSRAAILGMWKVAGTRYHEYNKAAVQVWDTRSVAPVSALLELPHIPQHVAVSHDGRFMAIPFADVRVFDMTTGTVVRSLPHAASFVSFHPDDRRLLTASSDKTLRLWDLSTGEDTVIERNTRANFAAFSPDGGLVASISGVIHDLSTGNQTILEGATGIVKIAFSHDGARVVTCHGFYPVTGRGFARVWDAHSGQPISPPLEHRDYVGVAAFSPDGRTVITGSRDRTARVWNATSGTPMSSPLPHSGEVNFVTFSANGERALTAASDGTARVWRVRLQGPMAVRAGGSLIDVAVSPNGDLIAGVGFGEGGAPAGEGVVWRTATGQAVSTVMKHQAPISQVRFSIDGESVITEDWSGKKRRWTTAGHLIDEDDATLLADTGDRLQLADDKLAVIRHSGNISITLKGTGHLPFVSADGRWVGVVTGGRTVQLWDAQTGRSIGESLKTDFDIHGAQFIAKSKHVLLKGQNEKASIWHADDGSVIQIGSFRHSESDRTGQRFAVIDYDARVGVWNLGTGESFYINAGRSPGAIAFSPSGAQLGVAFEDKIAQVFDAETGRQVSMPLFHRGPVTSIAFSGDERMVVTTSADGGVRVWEIETSFAISPQLIHGEGVNVARFVPGDAGVVSGGSDSWIKVWNISPSSDTVRDITQTAQLLSGLLQDDSGSLTPLTPQSLKTVLGDLNRR